MTISPPLDAVASAPQPLPEGRPRPRWQPTRHGMATAAIATLALLLYVWGLSHNGMANSYYAAAVRSGARSWKAFFFGSIDPGSFITVDKPPAALWVMDLSARLFGFSSWSMLLPEAVAGAGSVLILHRLVRRWIGDVAAHLAALGFALTPVAALMFRFNNPDALLTLLGLGAAWALWAAIETGRTRHLLLAGALTGLAFDAKMLQAFLIVPALTIAYLWAGPPRLGRRVLQLLAAGATLLVSAAWWVVIVALWPSASRPYIGSTTNNSIVSLVFGYNGLSRLFGSSGPGPGGRGGGGPNFGGPAAIDRLFNSILGGQIAWLLPLAGFGLVAGLAVTLRRPRVDRERAGWLLWGGWAVVSAAVFSLSKGIFHPYYAVQLAPAVAALAAAGAVSSWRVGRHHPALRLLLPAALVVNAVLAVDLLHRTPGYHAWLRTAIPLGVAVGSALLVAGGILRQRRVVTAAALVAAASLLAGPLAFTLTTVHQPSTGPTPSAGPGGGVAGPGGGFPGGGFPGGGFPGGGAGGGPGGGFDGGPGGSASASTGLIRYLEAHRQGARYLVAGFGSMSTASIIIASGQAVVTIGGFNGSDPAPTLAQFEDMVATGKVRYVLVGGSGGPGGPAGGGGPGGAGGPGGDGGISQWVTSHGTLVPSIAYGDSSGGSLYRVSA